MSGIRRGARLALTCAGVLIITWMGYAVVPVNSTTAGFTFLLFVLIVAGVWGFFEAAAASVLATLTFNFYFFEPRLTFTIADPQNWVALLSFLATALIASELSTRARRRAEEALERQQNLERLYTLGRAILLIHGEEPFARQLVRKVAEAFDLRAVVLHDPQRGEFHRAGPSDIEDAESQLREAALQGTTFSDPARNRVVFGVQLGAAPIASLALEGTLLPDSVIQSIGNLVAIGLERARAQELSHEVEAARRSEKLRVALLDALAHEFKTPLTSIRATTSSLLTTSDRNTASATRMLRIADEESTRLEELIDNALDTAQLESGSIQLDLEPASLDDAVRATLAGMTGERGDRSVVFAPTQTLPLILMDRRLIRLAIKQLLSNAIKYSPATASITVETSCENDEATLDVTDRGEGIPGPEQQRIFERFYRSSSVENQIPGSGLGLNIALRIAEAHRGRLIVKSRPGETTFRLILPVEHKES